MTFEPTVQLIVGLIGAAVVMLILWFVQLASRDAGIVDVGWSGLLGLLALWYGLTLPSPTTRTRIVMVLATIWAFRLALHLLFDRVLGKTEDGRYQRLRAGFGKWAQPFFFVFFQAQAILAGIFSISFWLAMQRTGGIDAFDGMGIALWVVSVVGESMADSQLAAFRREPTNKGKTCRRGLWKFSRHPNYFFEWLHWWAYVAFVGVSSNAWVALLSPLLMLFFLFKVTGIPATEAQAVASRGEDYRDYQRTTSAFIPWFPKQST